MPHLCVSSSPPSPTPTNTLLQEDGFPVFFDINLSEDEAQRWNLYLEEVGCFCQPCVLSSKALPALGEATCPWGSKQGLRLGRFIPIPIHAG